MGFGAQGKRETNNNNRAIIEPWRTSMDLAKDSINHDLGLLILDDPPIHAAQMFLDDISAVSGARCSRTSA